MIGESILQLQTELIALEQTIINLSYEKYQKEALVDDLKLLLNRISQETCFVNLSKSGTNTSMSSIGYGYVNKQTNQRKKEEANAPRKLSDETDISVLSKCISSSTKAHSKYHEDDDSLLCENHEYSEDNRKLNLFCSKIKTEQSGDIFSDLFSFWEVNINQPMRDCKTKVSI